MKKLARRLRSAREEAGLSLRELARRMDVSPAYVHRVEMGQHLPSDDRLRSMCQELDVDFDMMMLRTGRVPVDVVEYIAKTPGVLQRLRREMDAA